jgi:micrococcal nuclease
MLWLLSPLLTVLTISPAAVLSAYQGDVVGVVDGDIIDVLHDQQPERVRLRGIDCPEKGQAYGKRAKQAASALLSGKQVRLQTHGKDRYGRTLADVFLHDGTNVNHAMVKDGWCWWYQKHAPEDETLKRLEQDARDAKKGLWKELHPVPPWLYRRLRSGAYP